MHVISQINDKEDDNADGTNNNNDRKPFIQHFSMPETVFMTNPQQTYSDSLLTEEVKPFTEDHTART